MATIAKSSTLPHDSAPKVTVTSPAADEGSMQHTIFELTALCTSLQRQYSKLLAKFQAQEEEIVRLKERVHVLEDREGVVAKQSGDDAPIKGRSINEGEAATERISNDSEDIVKVLTSIDAATVLAGGIDVPTATRRKGKKVMVESDTPKKKILQEQIDAQVARELEEQQEKEDMRMNEQIARDAKVARIHAEEELQEMIDSLDKSNETIAKYLQEYQDFALDLPMEKRIELISDLVKYQDNYSKVEGFIPMGSKEETKRLKRKDLLKYLDREDLNQLCALVKEYLSIRPATSEKEMELWVELKRMYEPDPEDQLRSIKFRGGLLGIKCTRHSHCQRRVEDLQLGVESYQKRLNLTKPDTYRSDLKQREADGTLNDVCTALYDRLKGIMMQYLPQTIWRKGDKDRAAAMIQAIDKMLKTRRIMRSLEKFVRGRLYEGDFRMLQRTI
nr:hypothetical protein [Tanacetum cinerariifolium]